MRLFAIALFLAACSSPAAVASIPTSTPSPTPLPSPPPSGTREARLDPRDFTVGVAALPSGDEGHASRLILELPLAWHKATLGRSAVTIARASAGRHDITILLTGERDPKANALNYGSAIVMFSGQIDASRLLLVAMHELGHALGCCVGPGALDKHWTDCIAAPAQIMCGPAGNTTTFSERELAQMGLPPR